MSLPQQAWIEASLQWFVREFGMAKVSHGPVLPTRDLPPHGYSGTNEDIAALVCGMAEAMQLGVDLTLVFFDRTAESEEAKRKAPRTVGHYYVEDGQTIIGLDVTDAADPEYVTAIIAHEMSHVRLLGEDRISPDRKDGERLTDLLTVFFGFGVFTTNAVMRFGEVAKRGFTVHPLGYLDDRMLNAARNDGYSRLGYLTQREFGYAMACYAWLRHETRPAWAVHLDPGPRAYLRQGLAYLATDGAPGEFPTRRPGADPSAVRVTPKLGKPWLDVPYPRHMLGDRPPDAPGDRPR
ncbi:hypothetical protein ETD83_18765 [Actinomadura soli]|uniref:Uncharacterized protein n=1 Tax=Actinomadura soli TaxID=2508997 RepID=A0A5C4JAP7_9ACTN|nr:hypothetical protein [Actinomadura soli]TMQ98961.1 hypothetical protein ETD83_18765 [Actinomadura soli]